jgi:hypothetical protein
VDAAQWQTPRVTTGEYTRDGGQKGMDRPSLKGKAANWPTPDANVMNDWESPESFHARRKMLKVEYRNGNGAGTPLAVASVQWPTQGANDHKGSAQPGQRRDQLDEAAEQTHADLSHQHQMNAHAGPPSSPSAQTSRPRLNPDFVDWLMGLPPGWTACAALGTASCRSRPQPPSEACSGS